MGWRKHMLITCGFCNESFPINDVEFPDDLYDVMSFYDIPQLCWVCEECLAIKNKVIKNLAKNSHQTDQHAATSSSWKNQLTDDNSVFGQKQSTASTVSSSTEKQVRPIEIINDILKYQIKFDPTETKINKEVVKNTLEILISKLKRDNIFSFLYQEIYYTGSVYDELRITSAREFDLNLVLKLPFNKESRRIEFMERKPYAQYEVTDWYSSFLNPTSDERRTCEDITRKFFGDNYLIAEKVKRWLRGRVAEHFLSKKAYQAIDNVIHVRFKESGPANTLILKVVQGYSIEIDLVPVIKLSEEWPSDASMKPVDRFHVPNEDKYWFLVPKNYKSNSRSVTNDRTWRLHFPEVETYIIHHKECVKPVIKLVKQLRNKENWKILASYYIKTVVMLLVMEHPDEDYWKNNKVYQRLIEVLRLLCECIQKRFIPNIIYPEFNMIEKIGEVHAYNMQNRLKRIIGSIDRNPESLRGFFSMRL